MYHVLDAVSPTLHQGDISPPRESPPTALVTVEDLIALYETTHLPSLACQAPVRCRLRLYFTQLRPLPIHALTVTVVQHWVNTIRPHSKAQADSCLTLLRSMINLAITHALWKGQINPAIHVKRKKPVARTRYVTETELPGLIRELEREHVSIRLYFYLELFCGPRPGEVERMRRQHVNFHESGTASWFKPTTKTTEHWIELPVHITRLLLKHLAVISPATDWIFPGKKHHLSHEYWHARWAEIRERCGLGGEYGVQMRDLRRTISTHLLGDKEMDLLSLSKGVLNHSNLNTTQVYARPKRERVGEALNTYMQKTLKQAGVL